MVFLTAEEAFPNSMASTTELYLTRPNTDRYKKAGYETREDYLNDLAVRYSVNPIIVSGLAGILGAEEDFDGLVSAIEDMRDMIPAD